MDVQSMQDELTRKVLNRQLDMTDGKMSEKGWAEIADILQVYSDKRFETARYLFVQAGQIIRHVAVSCQNPSATISKFDEDFLFKLKTYAEAEAASVVFVHNHPSGYVVPSMADISTTDYIGNFFGERFAGHIILDHGNFGIYHPDHKEWNLMINGKFYGIEDGQYMLDVGKSNLGIEQLKNRKDFYLLADYAKQVDNGTIWNKDKWIPAFYVTHGGFVQSLEFIMNESLERKNYEATKNRIKGSAREAGCNHIIFVPNTHQQKLLCEAFAQESKMVQDIYFEKDDGTFELSNYHGGDIFNTWTKEEIVMSDQVVEKEEMGAEIAVEQNDMGAQEIEKDRSQSISSPNQVTEDLDDYIEMMNTNGGMPESAVEDELMNMEDYEDIYDIDETKDLSDKIQDTTNAENPLKSSIIESEQETVDNPIQREEITRKVLDPLEEYYQQEETEQEVLNFPTGQQQDGQERKAMSLDEELLEARQKIDRLEEQIRQLIKSQEELTKQYYSIMEENRMLKGQELDNRSPHEIKEKGDEQSLYTEEGQDRGSSKTFNQITAYEVNCAVPPFGHEQEDGSIIIIKNAHFAKRLLNEYDSSQNKVVLTYADETGKTHELKLDEFDYQKMVAANEEYERKKSGVEVNSYEWLLYSERYDKAMKTDQNKMRLNFASNFIHNYRILCKLHATNPQQAMDQASWLYDNMSDYEKVAFKKMRKEMGKKEFDELLLKEFKDHTQGIENKKSLVLNNNELLYDINKKQFEVGEGERIANSNLHVGDTVKMSFKIKNIDGKSVATPKLDFKILKATKNINPEIAIVYNDEEKVTYQVPIKELVRHQEKVRKQEAKEIKADLQKDNKKYGYTGRYM